MLIEAEDKKEEVVKKESAEKVEEKKEEVLKKEDAPVQILVADKKVESSPANAASAIEQLEKEIQKPQQIVEPPSEVSLKKEP